MHLGWILVIGTSLLAMAVLPHVLKGRPLSLPTIYVAFGWAAFTVVEPLKGVDPLSSGIDNPVVLYGSEVVVIVSLSTVGLSIERRVGLVSWSSVWRLLVVAMPLSVLAAMGLGWWLLSLGAPAALLLGAVLAPTDPVLADDIQVPAPGEDHYRDEVRFTLTAEAGLNDSFAFPVTYLAIAAAAASFSDVWDKWLVVDVMYRVAVGTVVGFVAGRLLTQFARRWQTTITSSGGVGVFILGATLVVYGATELVEGYGFLAVFIAALTRHDGIEGLRKKLHDFSEQFESMLVAFALIAVGGAIAEGILAPVGVREVVCAVILLLLVRPIAGWLSLIGSSIPRRERGAISFLGIKGIGSVYYLAYATANGTFEQSSLASLWAVVVLVMVGSMAGHGLSAPWIMRHLDHKRPLEETPLASR